VQNNIFYTRKTAYYGGTFLFFAKIENLKEQYAPFITIDATVILPQTPITVQVLVVDN